MTDQTRAKKGRRKRRSASQLFLAALVVFGIVASVLLLFSESVQWMRVGVLSALWAAVIGAFAMTKYRREAAADQTKAKDLQTVYELQLAREISARREYEMSVEARVRNETRLESDEVAALRNELAALRQNLQVLFEGNLPTERVALRAEAMRMQELGGRGYDSYQPAPSGLYVRGGGNGNGPAGPGFNGVGTPYDEPVTAETSVVYPEDPDEMPRATAAEADSRYAQDASAEQGSAPEGSDDVTDAGQNDRTEPPAAQSRPYGAPRPAGRVSPPTSPFTAYNFEQTRRPAAESEPAESAAVEDAEPVEEAQAQQAPESESAEEEATYPESRRSLRDSADAFFAADRVDDTPAEETADAPRRGRRRAESPEEASGAHSNGRSVAEIMAGLAGGDSADTTTTDAGTRRRRRRAD
ncbi:DUF6779 domain-containing protein [Rhodococcoides fascians]|uniref:DUF6779 domain-containing protein n=1 Tax=Rhodococcoides fascians TaxID=1828 RepID=UPI0007AACF31|nr:DUF6779 domain-containing protein [Rhodococcus fascians]AMY53849.1 hypothetical protein A3L23_02512 [Rhodococcus fascians D188]MDP9638042.1 hypothetical protein [Rhodococcus cercidiphylli]